MPTILIIEDDLVMLRLYEKLLEAEKYTILTAKDGEVGLEVASKNVPDLIILDIMMPKMDGLKVLEQLKANPITNKIRVIILSNLGNESIITDAMSNGAVSYLKKSDVNNEELIAEVKKFI